MGLLDELLGIKPEPKQKKVGILVFLIMIDSKIIIAATG